MYTTLNHDASFTQKVVERLGASWNHRVAVRQERLDLTQYCDDTIPEFPVSMVPFWDDEDFVKLTDAQKLRFLGAAWVAYNEKAMYLEDEIVQPLCSLLLKGRLPGAGDAQLKQVLETPPSVWPEQRLANEVAHRRARRYLSHEKELFQ